ncbi:MAG: PEP-CTERM sorting domain-containing protein [Verrucomicrobia bacterium]|nr:PEP-CTERM sorting domain-containing protein [Verrucomicrobiota bacterium]
MGGSVSAQIIGTVGVYDENVVNANTWNLDVSADKRVSSSVLGGDFTTSVLDAFNNNRGGVANFDGAGESLTFTGGVSAGNRMILGTDSALQLAFTLTDPDASAIPNGNQIVGAGGNSRLPISGANRLAIRYSMVFEFEGIYDATGTTLIPDAGVTQFGITMLSRDNRAWTGDVIVTFSDLSTQTISAFSVAQSVDTTETFIGFAAPSGLFINQVAFIRTTAGEYTGGFDDFGVVVIPEPSTYAMILGLFVIGVAAVRRRLRK